MAGGSLARWSSAHWRTAFLSLTRSHTAGLNRRKPGAASNHEKTQLKGGPGILWMFVRRSPLYQTEPLLVVMLGKASPVLKPGGSSQRTRSGSLRLASAWKLTPGAFFA